MIRLQLWQEYTREEVHSIFSPGTTFLPQRGTWGLHGIVRVPSRPGDWVFFVTFGQAQGEHVFDESITDEGVLSWQSQPAQELEDVIIRELIEHDDRVNTIHLFLRTKKGNRYGYFGALGYLTHDVSRQRPVHFQWQLLDWSANTDFLNKVGLQPVTNQEVPPQSVARTTASLSVEQSPPPFNSARTGVGKDTFQKRKRPDYAAKDARNRELGLRGELLVITHEKDQLIKAGRLDLAEKIVHVSQVEGDSAGYDIRSFESDGTHKFIEVKTTRGDATTSFFISPNEISFSNKNEENYVLFRLYEFDDDSGSAKTYLLKGNMSKQLTLEPTAFRAKLGALG
jgi:hypothetical protein